jgi:hypothetical protein
MAEEYRQSLAVYASTSLLVVEADKYKRLLTLLLKVPADMVRLLPARTVTILKFDVRPPATNSRC